MENLFGACNGAMIRLLRQMSRSEVPTRRTPRRVGHPLPWSFMRKTHMGQPPMIRSLPQMSRSVVPTRRTPRRVGHPLPRSFIRKTTWASPRRTGHPHFSFRAKRGTSRLSPGFVCPRFPPSVRTFVDSAIVLWPRSISSQFPVPGFLPRIFAKTGPEWATGPSVGLMEGWASPDRRDWSFRAYPATRELPPSADTANKLLQAALGDEF